MKNTYPTLAEAVLDTTTTILNTQPTVSVYEVYKNMRDRINDLSLTLEDRPSTFISPTLHCYVPRIDKDIVRKHFQLVARNLGLRSSFNGTYIEYAQ